jgi:hypothetical protein
MFILDIFVMSILWKVYITIMEVVDNLHPKCHPKLPSNKCELFIILNMKIWMKIWKEKLDDVHG